MTGENVNSSSEPPRRTPDALRAALLCWYPFPGGERALLIGGYTAPFLPRLSQHYACVDTVLQPGERYDCIAALDVVERVPEIGPFLASLASVLHEDGVLLLGFRNRFGLKYLCGGIDELVETPFSGVAGAAGLYGREQMRGLLRAAGFADVRCYCPMPDGGFAQAIYTEEYPPEGSIRDRVFPYDPYASPFLVSEKALYDAVVREGTLPHFANYYLMECRRCPVEGKKVVYAALSADRGEEHGFATVLYNDETARKIPLFPVGMDALRRLVRNSEELSARGICTVAQMLRPDGVEMPLIREPALLVYLQHAFQRSPEEALSVFEQIWRDVLASSDPGELTTEEALSRWGHDPGELGPILRRAYIDMIPYNAFWADGLLRYYDQEFTVENCPARYVLFRALRYTWLHIPEAESSLPLEQAKERFGLTALWDAFQRREDAFVAENRRYDDLRELYRWADIDESKMAPRRQKLLSDERAGADKPYGIGLLMGVFDLFHVGHLRLIRRAKAQCRYLRVAVLSDALVMRYKSVTPTIPLSERVEILAAIREVDEVVVIEDEPSRLLEWDRRPFDCFFSGDDYRGNAYWEWERGELRTRGADIVFFPYTQEQSSTKIRKKLEGNEE